MSEDATASLEAISFNLAKVAGQGEDADPVCLLASDETWISVFDGMGGAGAVQYDTEDGPRTGAYLASRLARSAFLRWVAEAAKLEKGYRANDLYRSFSSEFRAAEETLAAPASRVRSKLLKTLPTTIAACGISVEAEDRVICDALWAGDSRVFFWTPYDGLIQVSKDQLKEDLDPQANIAGDSPLSNCISADGSFYLEEALVPVTPPLLVLAATDGCFGYVASPILFEALLLQTGIAALSLEEWRLALEAELTRTAGDDASMAMVPIGWPTFNDVRADLGRRYNVLSPLVARLEGARHELSEAEVQAVAARGRYEVALRESWDAYKARYLANLVTRRAGE